MIASCSRGGHDFCQLQGTLERVQIREPPEGLQQLLFPTAAAHAAAAFAIAVFLDCWTPGILDSWTAGLLDS